MTPQRSSIGFLSGLLAPLIDTDSLRLIQVCEQRIVFSQSLADITDGLDIGSHGRLQIRQSQQQPILP